MGSHPAETEDDSVMREYREQARANPPIGAAEREQLLRRSADGDRASQDRLVAANLGVVIRLAEARGDRGLSVPDLVQEGSLGLVDAVRSFSGSGATDFEAFAAKRIGDQMDAAIAAEASAVHEAELLVAAATDYEKTELTLRRELQREATVNEIAEKLEWTIERTQYVAQVVADARRRHDEELLQFIDPDTIDFDGSVDGN